MKIRAAKPRCGTSCARTPARNWPLAFAKRSAANDCAKSALSGEIEKLLNWINVEAGNAFLIPAGTVHAIGAGLAICEIQQHSDVTYRLYDYGRPRELHLDKAMQVASTDANRIKSVPLPIDSPVLPHGVGPDRIADSLRCRRPTVFTF